MIDIIRTLKNVFVLIRTWIKLILLVLLGFLIIGLIIYFVYQPVYSVRLNGDVIGYTENKKILENKINSYINGGDSQKIAFVEMDTLPSYSMCLLKKGIEINDEEIFYKVISSGVSYYKYYAILENNIEKMYVETYDEAENIVQTLKEKNSNNQNNISYALKYESELKTFTDVETAVASLYVEKPKTTTKTFTTSKTMDYNYTALGINLINPVAGTITSRFGRRSSGIHTGLDIANSVGTPIKAAADGTVIYAGYKGSYGNLVVIAHSNSVETYYAHCSKIYVSANQSVKQGDVIAAVGSTGNSTGPHLHLEIRVNGYAKNPQNYLYK